MGALAVDRHEDVGDDQADEGTGRLDAGDLLTLIVDKLGRVLEQGAFGLVGVLPPDHVDGLGLVVEADLDLLDVAQLVADALLLEKDAGVVVDFVLIALAAEAGQGPGITLRERFQGFEPRQRPSGQQSSPGFDGGQRLWPDGGAGHRPGSRSQRHGRRE